MVLGAISYEMNAASESAGGKKVISDDVKVIAEFSEGLFTVKVTGWDKMPAAEAASNAPSAVTLTLDGLSLGMAKTLQN